VITSQPPLLNDPSSNTGSNSQKVSELDTNSGLKLPVKHLPLARGFAVKPQPSNRRGQQVSKGLHALVDWLSGTVRFTDFARVQELLRFVEGYVGEEIHLEPGVPWHCGITFAHSGRSLSSVRVGWNEPDGDDCLGHLILSVPGLALSRMSVRDVWRMLSGLVNVWGFKTTVVHPAIDDYEKQLDVKDMVAAIEAGNYARFRPKSKKGAVFTRSLGGSEGFTLYMGSPSSDRRTRHYNKEAESEGRIPCYRTETVLKDELAQSFVDGWLAISPENFEELSPKYIAGTVAEAIDFPARLSCPGEKNLSRIPRLDWWQKFLDRVGASVRHSRPVVVRSLEKTLTWTHRQVVRALAVAQRAVGKGAFRNWFSREMDWADENLTPFQEYLARQYRVEEKGSGGFQEASYG